MYRKLTIGLFVVLVVCVRHSQLYGQELVFSESGGVQLVSIPQSSPGEGFLATKIQARTVNPDWSIATYVSLSFSDIHHVWVGNGLQPPGGNALGPPITGPTFAPEWLPYDSHLLITSAMVGGSALQGYDGITESNDGSSLVTLPAILDGSVPALPGFGDMIMPSKAAFFTLPAFQQDTVDLAYLVTDESHDPKMSLQMLGATNIDIANATEIDDLTWRADFGLSGATPNNIEFNPIAIPFRVDESRVGSVAGPLQFSERFRPVPIGEMPATNEIVEGSRVPGIYLPVSIAAAPDFDAAYSVGLTGVTELRDDGDFFSYGGPLDLESFSDIPAGTTRNLGPFHFDPSEPGDWSADYELSFNDGTVVSASFAATVISDPTPPPFPGEGFVVAELGGVRLVAVHQPSPGGDYQAVKLVAHTFDPNASIIAITNLAFSGAHQVWPANGLAPPGGTARGKPTVGPTFHDEWLAYDSHVLISADKVCCESMGGYEGISESNDGATSNDLMLSPVVDGQVPALSGYGDINMASPDDEFSLLPQFQGSEVELAYLVTSGHLNPVGIQIGIRGDGIVDAGLEGGAAFGYDGNPTIYVPYIIPEPLPASQMLAGLMALSLVCRRPAGQKPKRYCRERNGDGVSLHSLPLV